MATNSSVVWKLWIKANASLANFSVRLRTKISWHSNRGFLFLNRDKQGSECKKNLSDQNQKPLVLFREETYWTCVPEFVLLIDFKNDKSFILGVWWFEKSIRIINKGLEQSSLWEGFQFEGPGNSHWGSLNISWRDSLQLELKGLNSLAIALIHLNQRYIWIRDTSDIYDKSEDRERAWIEDWCSKE